MCDDRPGGQNPGMKKLLLALVALIIIAAVVIAVRTIGERDETDAVDSKDAASLVQDDDGDDDDDEDAPTEAGLRPEPGTYTYTGTGRESVDVLGGSEHVFPETVPVVVELDDDPDSCEWTSNVIYVKQHVEERSFCTTEETVIDRGFERTIEFFGRTQETSFECGNDAIRLRADAKPGDTWSWTCTDEDAKATSEYTLTYVGPETLTIDGDTTESWLASSGLPVRFSGDLKVRTKSVLGETNFQERFRYELTSLTPTNG